MAIRADDIIDRRRLRRKLSLWRGLALAVAALAVVGAAFLIYGEELAPTAVSHIAKVKIEGTITEDDELIERLRKIREARAVKGVILSIDSPGGTTAGGEPAPSPKPGMSAVVDLRVRTASDAVAAPASAVFRDGERDAVWLVVDGTVKRRQVVVGAQGEQSVEVVEGLAEGDRIVVGGADAVVEGQRLP